MRFWIKICKWKGLLYYLMNAVGGGGREPHVVTEHGGKKWSATTNLAIMDVIKFYVDTYLCYTQVFSALNFTIIWLCTVISLLPAKITSRTVGRLDIYHLPLELNIYHLPLELDIYHQPQELVLYHQPHELVIYHLHVPLQLDIYHLSVERDITINHWSWTCSLLFTIDAEHAPL